MSRPIVFWSVLTGMALVVPVCCVIQLLPLPTVSPQAAAAAAERFAHVPLWALALKAVIVFPVLEECVYRGVILQLLRRYLPLWAALVPPTLIFGLTHWGFSPQNAVFALLVGLYFAWLMIGSRSLFPSILCHAAINLFVVFVMRLVFGVGPGTNPRLFLEPVPLLLLACSLVVLTIGIRRLRGEFRGPVGAFTAA